LGGSMHTRQKPLPHRRLARRVVAVLAPLTLALLAIPAAAVAATPDAAPGVKPLATTQDLFVGGTFNQAGGRVANNIARWPGGGADWGALSGPVDNGTNGQVTSITVYNGKLIAAGSFTTAGGLTVNGIAAWDGGKWSPLVGHSGIPGLIHFPLDFVETLAVYNGNLYAGGQFVAAGGTLSVNNIVEWNGSDWVALSDPQGTGTTLGGSPTGGAVFGLTVYNNTLVASGGFDAAGGIASNRVASWNGTSWSPLSLPERGEDVLALTVYNGQLVADDEFVQNNQIVENVDAFNGTSWTTLGTSFNNEVRTLTVYNNRLVAGGFFTTVGGTTANHIAAWDGTSWSALPGPVEQNAVIYTLGVSNGNLVAGGFFVEIGGTRATNVAEWNGTSWSALTGPAGEGTDSGGTVFALFSTTVL
jgi:hypothetical protein